MLLMNVIKQSPTDLAVLGVSFYSLNFVMSRIFPPINQIEIKPCLQIYIDFKSK